MIRVEEAEKIIQSQIKDYGTERISLDHALGRVLAENITADRDLPPYNRVTMDGIAIRYEALAKGVHVFSIKATQAAGDDPFDIENPEECIEIMTGAALPQTTDTIIPYEQITVLNGTATVKELPGIQKGQNIHFRGKDKKQNEIVIEANRIINPAVINIAAAVGKTVLTVKKAPRIVIISTGDELVDINETPLPYQVRRSNNYAIKGVLEQYNTKAALVHLPDDPEIIKQQLQECLLRYDVILLSGGISMGKFDHVPGILGQLEVNNLFYKVQQRPGKPFWFGVHTSDVLVFAFPGNPVSTFMCLHRYFLPWLTASLGIPPSPKQYAVLDEEVIFDPDLQYFIPVQLMLNNKAELRAKPLAGNGSGDFANLTKANAFMELPLEESTFKKGEVYTIWPFTRMF